MGEPAISARISIANPDAIERQIEDGFAYFKRLGREVPPDNIFRDDGKSASALGKKQRSDYQRLLAAIEAGKIDHVWMWAEDRTHRQVIELHQFIELCRTHGVRVATAGTEYDLSDPDQVTMWYIKVRFAEAEVERLSRRLKRQQKQAAERGVERHAGTRAFGHTGVRRVKRADGGIDIEPIVSRTRALEEQELIKEAARRILAGDSLRGIVGDWNRRGILSATDGKWNNQVLRRMLLSPRIAGFRQHNGKLYPGQFAAIIEPATWQAVKAILTDPSRKTSDAGGQPRHLLTGLARCGVCDRPLRARMLDKGKGKGRYRVYYCHPVNGGSGYHVVRQADSVDDLITTSFFVAIETDDFNEAASSLQPDDPTRPHFDRQAEITAEVDAYGKMALAAEARQIAALPPKPGRSLSDIEAKISELEQEWERENVAIGRLKHDRVRTYVPRDVRKLWPDYSLDRKRNLLAACIETIRIHPQRQPGFDPNSVELVTKDWN
jgi:DNA invertase Pin-like site-specific DNA recombinase